MMRLKHTEYNNLHRAFGICCSAIYIVFRELHTGRHVRLDSKGSGTNLTVLFMRNRPANSHDFLVFLTGSRQDSQSHGFLGENHSEMKGYLVD